MMRTNYNTKQFAEYLRKLVIAADDEWRVSKVTTDSKAGEEYFGKGPWAFFSVEEYDYDDKWHSTCGVYVGPKRAIYVEPVGLGIHPRKGIGKANEIFEKRVRDVLAGK